MTQPTRAADPGDGAGQKPGRRKAAATSDAGLRSHVVHRDEVGGATYL